MLEKMLSKVEDKAEGAFALASVLIALSGFEDSEEDARAQLSRIANGMELEEPSGAGPLGGLMADSRAQGASSAVELVVALVVGGLMAAFLLPIAIDEISSVDTSSWTSGAASLWNILPVMIVLAIFLFFTYLAVRRAR